VSSFVVVAYIAISRPDVLVGVIAERTNIRDAGLILAAVVAMLAATVTVLLLRQREVTLGGRSRNSSRMLSSWVRCARRNARGAASKPQARRRRPRRGSHG
jgi:hypothetical protein